MISLTCDFSEFIASIKDMERTEIIIRTEQEATAAERCFYRKSTRADKDSSDCGFFQYAAVLKDFLKFLRYGVMTSQLRKMDIQILNQLQMFSPSVA